MNQSKSISMGCNMDSFFTKEQEAKTDLFRIRPMNTIGLYGPQDKRNFEQHETSLAMLIMELKINPNDEVKKVRDEIMSDAESDFIYNVLQKRCNYHQIKFEPLHLIFISALSVGIPAHAIMYLHAANAARVILGKESICIFDMFKFFADGFPTEKALDDWWSNSFKGKVDTQDLRVWPRTIADIEVSAI